MARRVEWYRILRLELLCLSWGGRMCLLDQIAGPRVCEAAYQHICDLETQLRPSHNDEPDEKNVMAVGFQRVMRSSVVRIKIQCHEDLD